MHQAGERERAPGERLPVQGDRREPDREADGNDPADAWRDHRAGEQRRQQEQRRDPGEHEDEARKLVPLQTAEQLSHDPTIVGIAV